MNSVTALVIGDPHFKVANVRETDAMSAAIVNTAVENFSSFLTLCFGSSPHIKSSIFVFVFIDN